MKSVRVAGWILFAFALAFFGLVNVSMAVRSSGTDQAAHIGIVLGAFALADIAMSNAEKEDRK